MKLSIGSHQPLPPFFVNADSKGIPRWSRGEKLRPPAPPCATFSQGAAADSGTSLRSMFKAVVPAWPQTKKRQSGCRRERFGILPGPIIAAAYAGSTGQRFSSNGDCLPPYTNIEPTLGRIRSWRSSSWGKRKVAQAIQDGPRPNLFLTLGGMQDRISPRLVSTWFVPSPRPSEF